ncbi:hypothetical protein CLV46_1501 [Diaminobutyricimonas aerilata]|uniref:CopC domain-containing protein n=1 Tax=Diaminobutyricimonas aerilata TaxID=1162967 RepID=A0A2M9CJ71_9MICO|nr:copper resistance CopC family protein [Diaminobutyricimonas aerilata]PJJ71942.1 hypothetical protein CLV46_1501 [Diaminobutyricimonas aerilata]
MRRPLVAIAALTLGVGVAVAAPLAASAHSYLVGSTPVADSTVTEAPELFSVTMNENVLDVTGEAAGFALQVRDADGRYYGDGCLTIEGATVSTTAKLGEPGAYTLGWQVVSADGHTVSDELSFEWAPPAGYAPAEGADSPGDCGGTVDPAPPSEADGGNADGPADDAGAAVPLADLLWIGGAVLAVAAAVVVALLVAGRRRAD